MQLSHHHCKCDLVLPKKIPKMKWQQIVAADQNPA
jgi:hypothetical protein